MLLDKSAEPAQKITQKTFVFDKTKFVFHTTETIRITENNLDSDSQRFINPPLEAHQNRFFKKIQLQLAHHSITIQDDFRWQMLEGAPLPSKQMSYSKLQNQSSKLANKKTVLFRNNLGASISKDKGGKKNVVKNIVTAFIYYFKELIEEGIALEKHINLLKALIAKVKFNNTLINQIISNDQLRSYFRIFLSHSAAQWVQNSKLKSKQTHLQAIALYEKFCNQKNDKLVGTMGDVMQMDVQNDQNEYYFQSGINHDLQEQIELFK